MNETDEEQTYSIVRFYMKHGSEVIATGQTLEEVQEWCSRDDTHGADWFDGYRKE